MPGRGGTVTTVVWWLTDGKPGHENQSRGLIASLEKRRPLDVHLIPTCSAWAAGRDFLGNRFPPGEVLPSPDLILAAGHSTHAAALAARRARGGRLVVLMRPTLPLSWFDLCLIPEHDLQQASPAQRAGNVIGTRGVLNKIQPAEQPNRSRGLLLVGGPSKHHDWDQASVVRQITQIVASTPGIPWTLTTSRRTPAAFLEALALPSLGQLQVIPESQTQPGWVAAQLAASGIVFVTEDSVSMVYESLSAGANVGLLQLPRRRTSRVVRGIDRLVE
ncbi:MAG: mitochondrial fission ELM1 family protein, partial [Planctomycetaceae bacterium]|nr:mitochondrial fission ELM1 family protein [Planctomycetaceae bacterium]